MVLPELHRIIRIIKRIIIITITIIYYYYYYYLLQLERPIDISDGVWCAKAWATQQRVANW